MVVVGIVGVMWLTAASVAVGAVDRLSAVVSTRLANDAAVALVAISRSTAFFFFFSFFFFFLWDAAADAADKRPVGDVGAGRSVVARIGFTGNALEFGSLSFFKTIVVVAVVVVDRSNVPVAAA